MFIARARGEVLEAAPQPRRARGVLAAPDDFVLVADERAAARAARRRHHPRLRVRRPQAEDRRDDARDDVAGLLDHDRVPFAEILAREVLGVVQRRHRDRRAGDEHRLEDGVRRVGAGAADVDFDLQQLRVRLLRGELERRRPARELRRRPQLLAQREVVDLDDDAVGVELEVAPRVAPTRCRTRSARRRRRSAASGIRRAGRGPASPRAFRCADLPPEGGSYGVLGRVRLPPLGGIRRGRPPDR